MEKRLRHAFIAIGAILAVTVAYMLFNYIGALVTGVFVYYSTRPLYRRLCENIPPTIAAFIAPIVFLVPAVLLVVYTLRIITVEIRALAIRASDTISPTLLEFIDEERIEQLIGGDIPLQFPTPQELQQQYTLSDIISMIRQADTELFESIIDAVMNLGVSTITSLSGLFFNGFIAFALAFYLLRDGHVLKEKLFQITDYNKHVIEYTQALDRDLKVVFFGNILLMIITGVLGAFAFVMVSVFVPGGYILSYPALIGFLCGVTSLIPVVGMKIVYFPVTATILGFSLAASGFPSGLLLPIVFLIIAFVIVDTIPDLIIRPYIGSRGGISTGLLLFAYILGPLTFGWYGLFLGPLVFVAFAEFVDIIIPQITN